MTPGQALAMYRRQRDRSGKAVVFRRYTGTGTSRTPSDVNALAHVSGYAPHQLAGTIQQGDVRVIVMVEDLGGFVPRNGDKVVVSGKELNVEACDLNTRDVADVLISYDIQARG